VHRRLYRGHESTTYGKAENFARPDDAVFAEQLTADAD
jgi:hypothetical protein